MRINVVKPEYLMDQHLIAEYGEIQNMMLAYYRRSMKTKIPFDWASVPEKYTLNKGHAKFFYNKMGFVIERFNSVVKEMHHRGFNTNLLELDYSEIPIKNMGSYIVTEEDIQVNLERITQRIGLKPTWYRFHGKYIDCLDFYKKLSNNTI
jgi:deoxyribonuclease (pyrimidine dimer)